MSTRSGKRIHGSFHENEVKVDGELVAKSERKTRSRRLKENDEVVMPKSKKRNNYVSYPTDDEVVDTMTTKNTNGDVSIKETLKEQDLNVSSTLNTTNDTGKVIRQTRRTKKISENIIEDAPVPEVVEKVKGKKKAKKNKKKMEEPGEVNENDNPPTIPKKSKKKKGKNANPFKEEIIEPEINNLNKSNGSQDSFHSAAGSPLKENCITEVPEAKSQRALKRLKADSCEDLEEACLREEPDRKIKKVKLTNLNNSEANNRSLRSKEKENPENKDATFDKSHETLDGSILKQTQEKRRSSIKNSTFDRTDTPSKINKKFNSTFEKTNSPTPKKSNKPEEASSERKLLRSLAASKSVNGSTLNCTFEKESTLNNTFDKSKNSTQSKLNSTFDKSNDSKQSALNSTYEKHNDSSQSKFNSTFEKSTDPKGSTMNSTFEKSNNAVPLNSTFEKRKSARQSLNTTFEKTKDSTQPNLNSTFDKEIKLNSTYEKTEDKLETSKSSLISSDNTSNVTLDKSNENSRISITSDDSRTENIVNTTPLLIESSLEESQIRDPTPKKTDDKEASLKTSTTPLKREGTFTKDSPDVMSKPTNGTPVKRMSLPSPGSTPFPFSKSGQKEKSMMNVTRSIEKATRRASLAETAQRQTRVMFCSPVNNPVVAMQQKKKVIKSSMKGSNKSFLFDESASEAVRPAARKRSYTQNDADDVRSKRKRLADPQQHSVDRLSRPRTCSATVKLSEPSTPSKKPTTPLRKVLTPRGASEAKPPRTKLPNFAALHQKQFDKMESLGECQQRRARRARALLTPSGAPNIIEKSSPKIKATATEPVKAVKEVAKKTDTPTKTPKLPTLMSLRPGYTRFGFKMHLDDNPFSIPPKTEKPKEKKPNGALIRQPSQPSLTGATVSRREVAKQTVMREKSFTSLSDKRNVTRKENRSVIKGVRTNRRFELQMKMRNINS